MRKLVIWIALLVPASSFGLGDTPVLLQILAENVKQLIQLENILRSGRDSLYLLQDINRGINDSLNLIRTIGPINDPGLYGDLKRLEDVLGHMGRTYGKAAESPDAKVQADTDRSIGEAITMNNAIFEYTKKTDKIGEDIKSFSHSVSPGGAQKLTAQSMGVLVHVMNQSLRAQGTLLKLQAQSLAQNNKREKDYTAEYLKVSGTLSSAMKQARPVYQRPRF